MDKLKDIDFGAGSGLLSILIIEVIARIEADTTLVGQLPPLLILALGCLAAFARFFAKNKGSSGQWITEDAAKQLAREIVAAMAAKVPQQLSTVPGLNATLLADAFEKNSHSMLASIFGITHPDEVHERWPHIGRELKRRGVREVVSMLRSGELTLAEDREVQR